MTNETNARRKSCFKLETAARIVADDGAHPADLGNDGTWRETGPCGCARIFLALPTSYKVPSYLSSAIAFTTTYITYEAPWFSTTSLRMYPQFCRG